LDEGLHAIGAQPFLLLASDGAGLPVKIVFSLRGRLKGADT